MVEVSDSMDIMVLCGGSSTEADVSRRSGAAVAAALERRGHRVRLREHNRDTWAELLSHAPDCVWLALHGMHGEDGSAQGLLETLRIPYTGTGIAGSAVAMDKMLARRIARDVGCRVPETLEVDLGNAVGFTLPRSWSFPVIVKPCSGGSSVATRAVHTSAELGDALLAALAVDDRVLIEPLLRGREISVAIFDDRVLGDIEIIPAGGIYDYEAKYVRKDTKYIVSPQLDSGVRADMRMQALQAARACRTEGVVRADFILVGSQPTLIELNTIPGMTEQSLLPQIAAKAGLSFDDLVEAIAHTARLKC